MEEEKQVLLFPKMIPEIINKQVENNEIFLLDIRDDVEWNEGHIAGAKHITLDNLNIKTTRSIPRDLPIYVYCRSGRRAIEAEFKLRALGFSKIENIGGIIHWKERGGMLTN
jgi:phage shock protein E